MVLHHHEFFDGSGYPEALSGEKIPLGARIITIADSYDTITSDRSYKKGRTAEQALSELERCANSQFDAHLVEAFVRAMRQLAQSNHRSSLAYLPQYIVRALASRGYGSPPR